MSNISTPQEMQTGYPWATGSARPGQGIPSPQPSLQAPVQKRGFGRWLRLLGLAALTCCGIDAQAATFTVANVNDAGSGSLREAITLANAAGTGPHTISFSASGTILLQTALPAVTNANVTVDGGNTIIISANVADVDRDCFTIGANNVTLKNIILQNTGGEGIYLNGILTGVTIDNVIIRNTLNDYINHGIYVNNKSTNMTIRNVSVTDVQDNYWGIRFINTVTNLTIDGYHMYNGGGGTSRGIQIQGVANGVTIRNSNIDLDDPATTNDGDYGVYFNTTASNVTVDSSEFHDNEVYGLFFGGAATGVRIRNSRFDNFDGYTSTQFIRFASTTTQVYIDNINIDADQKNTTNDADYGIVFVGNAQRVKVTRSKFNEIDFNAMQFQAINCDSIVIDSNFITGTGTTNEGRPIEFYGMRNGFADAFPVLITNNTITRTNGIPIVLRPGDGGNYTIPNVTVSGNTITTAKGQQGAIQINYIDKINITQNYIYNNQGKGIYLYGSANCGYVSGATTVQLVASAPTATPGTYNVQMKLPAVCGTGKCTVELYSTEAGMRGIGGQHYVTTLTGLSSGTATRTVSGVFTEMTAAPYGTFTATMKVTNNNCGTSEYSNKIGVRPIGPAGVDSGIQVWANPDILEEGNFVQGTGWEDFSGMQRNFTGVSSDPARVSGGINTNHYVNFDGNDYVYPGTPGFVKTMPAGEVITVTKTNSTTTTNGSPYDFGGNSNHHYTWTNGAVYNDFGTNDRWGYNTITKAILDAKPGTTISGGTIDVKQWNIYGTHSATNNWGIDFNGGKQTVQTSTNTINFTLGANREYIGATHGYAFNGDVAESALWSRALSATERQRVNSYYAIKYGLTLGQSYLASDGTTVWWNITANAAYSKGIAGIARDKRSVLHQKQSRSISMKDVVMVGVGNRFFSTFEDHDGNIANDKSAFVWGTDSATTNFSVAFATAYSDYRMARKWKVQKTNWSDTLIVLKLDKGNRNRSLIISTDPTFTTGVSSFRLNDTGAVVLNSSNFANGAYFTFANLITAPACVTLGIQGWYRADDPSATGALWGDYSGYDHDAIQATAANQPTMVPGSMNYNAALDFDGNDRMAIANNLGLTGTTNWTVLTAAVSEAGTLHSIIGSDNTTVGRGYNFRINPAATVYSGTRSTGACGVASTATTVLNVPVLAAATRTGNSWNTYVNNVAGTAATCTNSLLGNYWLGWHAVATTEYMNGKVGEVIVYNRALSTTELQTVNSYLAIKYGITMAAGTQNYLASNNATIWDATANASFRNSIAGIGKDTCGSFHQRQGRSINTGTPMALAFGEGIAATNTDNSYNIINNISYLTWGDNNKATTFNQNVAGENATVRMPRTWKVQKTNWADSFVTVKFFGNVTNTYLLISNTDTAFGTIDQELAFGDDSTVTFNSSLLPSGAYFTFGKAILGPGFVNSGIQAWYRADVTAAPGQWNDYSGNANDAVQPTVVNQPSLLSNGINYLPSLKFDGANSYMDVSSQLGFSTAASNFTVVGLTRRNSANSLDGIIQQNATTALGAIPLYYSSATLLASRNGLAIATGTLTHTANTVEFTSVTRTGSAFVTYTNGNQDGTGTNSEGNLNLNMRIGNRSTTGDMAFDGQIGEIAVYNRALSAAEQARVYSYLAMKYGVTYKNGTTAYVNTSGDTIWSPVASAGYQSRVTAIGRDDKTGLNQKQSRNQDTATIGYVSMALSNTEAANADNTSIFEDDGSFLFWSDNNATTAPAVSVAGDLDGATLTNGSSCLLQRRLPKTFRVTNVNDVTGVQVRVNLKGISLAGTASALYLAINSTAAFTGTIKKLVQATSYTNGLAVFDDVDFEDGDFFTVIGEKAAAPGNVQADIALWLQGDNGVNSDGTGKVTQWDDQSTAGANATQAVAANQPAVSSAALNFNNALVFDGAGTYLDINNNLGFSATAADFTVISMNRRNAVGAANQVLLSQNVSTANAAMPLYYSATAGALMSGRATNTAIATGALTHTVNVPEIASVTRTGSSFATFTNGLADGTGTYAGGYVAANMRIGSRAASELPFNGTVAEVITYKRALNATELNKVYSYLGIKYGVSIDQTTPTNYTASDGTVIWTGDAAYKSRIAGIGMDVCSGLQQRQSANNDAAPSANAVNVTIGLGNIAADNESNDNDFTSDKSFDLWADNNASTSFTTVFPDNSYNVSYRMPRVWKVAETGTVGSVRVALPYTRIANPDKAYLVVNNGNATFSDASSFYPLDTMTVNGVLNYFADVDFANNDYFTYASDVKVPGGVAGQTLWMRPDYGTNTVVDGVQISEWSEYGAELNRGTQSVVAAQPYYANNATDNVNYNPMIKFNSGTTNGIFMNLDPTLLVGGSTARTILGVARPSIAPAARDIISWGTGALATATGNTLGAAGTAAGNYAANGNMVSANNLWTANGVNELMATYAGGTNGAIGLYSRNRSVLATAATRTLNTTITAGTPAYLGRGIYNATEDWNGTIGDVIVYPFVLSATQRQQVESYLSIKYGYTMDQTTPTDYLASDGTTVTWTAGNTYKYRISGICRDDKTGLLQRQSRNIDTTSPGFVTMAVNELAADNGSNDGAFADDKSFLLWGDDNAGGVVTSPVSADSTGTTIDVSACAQARRLAKTFRVQQTGTVDNVQVQVNLKGLNMGLVEDVYLAISSLPTFGSTIYKLVPASSLNNNIAVFDGVSFNGATQYFTILGKKVESPASVGSTGLQSWLKADDGVELTDTTVSAWQDQTIQLTNGTAATASVPGYRPVGLNFNPSIAFNGSTSFMDLAANLNSGTNANVTVYTVYKPAVAGTATTRYIWGNGTSATTRYLTQTNDAAGAYTLGNIVNRATISGMQYSTTALATNVFVNGIQTSATGQTQAAANAGATAIRLGGTTGNTSYFNGDIAEFIVYNRTLTTTERAKVESYLAIKYGITLNNGLPTVNVPNYLSSGGATIWSYDALTGYNRRVFGIGRDFCSDLNQKQSTSLDSGASILTMGLGGIMGSNAENTNTFDNDLTYVLVADNGGAITEQTTELPTAFASGTKRLGREWKATVTGTAPTNLSLQFNLGASSITAGSTAADFELIIDNDGNGNFSDGTTTRVPAADWDGTNLTFNNVTLANTQVFSVITKTKRVGLNAKIYLQADMPASGTTMRNDLQLYNAGVGVLPTTDPFSLGAECANINSTDGPCGEVVDWVKIELRSAAAPGTVLQSKALVLKTDGTLVDPLNGGTPQFDAVDAGVRVVVKPRNHLAVMGNAITPFNTDGNYDFTTAVSQASSTGGNPAQMKTVNGVWCLWVGDVNSDNVINSTDYNLINAQVLQGSFGKYYSGDVNMDGIVNSTDINLTNASLLQGIFSTLTGY